MVGWSVPGVVHLREMREDLVGRRVLARHRITRKSLAITYLCPDLLADSEFRTRFARDVARLARVRQARVARVHRYYECPQGAAVIGDHVSGMSLRALLLAQGAVGTEAALVVLQDSLRALAACHAVGLTHGDLKPEGVILTPAGQLRLVDFGLWSAEGRRQLARLTPFYLAPEQWSGSAASPAGDVYAATVTFFECLAGAPPFYADGAPELSAKHDRSMFPVDVVPEPVRELVAHGLTKDPHHRGAARSLLAQVGAVAARTFGAGWERRGRRELAALLADRSTLPEVSALTGSTGAGWQHRKPVRLAAVMGGALALAAGLASPPLAVIVPSGSIFGSSGTSPVLAFPDPDRNAAPVRVVTNGPLAGHALAASAGSAGPVARARPPARSIPTPIIQTAPYVRATPGARQQGGLHRANAAQSPSSPDQSPGGQSTVDQPTVGQSAPVPSACTQGLISAHQPCAAGYSEQPPGVEESASDPLPVLTPVALPSPVVVPVILPAGVEVPVQVLKPILVREKIHSDQHTQVQTGWPDPTAKTGEPMNQPWADSGGSGDDFTDAEQHPGPGGNTGP